MKIHPSRKRALASAALLLSISSAVAGQELTPAGAEFQVNDYVADSEGDPHIAFTAAGDFVVVWHSYGSPGTDDAAASIQMRRFSRAGTPLAGQVQVNTQTSGFQRHAAVRPMSDGGFLVIWDSGLVGVKGQRFDAFGAAVGGEIDVSEGVEPEVAVDGAGDYVVVWEDFSSDPDGDVVGRKFDSAGSPLGDAFEVNTYTPSFQARPDIAMSESGEFMATWFTDGATDGDTSDFSIQGRLFDSAANPVGDQFQVNTTTAGGQYYPAADTDADGNFLVVWTDLNLGETRGRRILASGSPAGDDFPVSGDESIAALRPSIAGDSEGFVVAWGGYGSEGTDTSSYSTQARHLGPDGSPLDDPFQVNTYTTGGQAWQGSAVAADGQGHFVVVWRNDNGLGSPPTSIRAQRFFTGIFEDGFESGNTSAWSAAAF